MKLAHSFLARTEDDAATRVQIGVPKTRTKIAIDNRHHDSSLDKLFE